MIRSSKNHLFAFALLLAPLALLAVLGGTELGRLAERAQRAIEARAATLRDQTVRRLQEEASKVLQSALEALEQAGPIAATQASRLLASGLDQVDGLLALDERGRLAYPSPAPAPRGVLPASDDDPALLRAELLDLLGDTEGARNQLRRVAAGRAGDPSALTRARGTLLMASALRREGDPSGAAELYAAFDRWSPPGGNRPARREFLACKLLARLGGAELVPEPERQRALTNVLDEVARGAWNSLPEGLLGAVWERAVEHGGAPDDALVELDAQRRADREFAPHYEEFLEPAVRRRLGEADRGAGAFGVADLADEPRTLLLIHPRPPSADLQFPDLRAPPEWLGVRIDLDSFLATSTDLGVDDPEFRIELLDPDLELPSGERGPTEAEGTSPATAGPFGLLVRATPRDLQAILRERSRQGWIRILLILGLCTATAGGAILLLRSVQRERELLGTRVELVGRVSHEFRTPLALIRMYAETLGMGRARTDEQRRHFAEIIVRESDGLSRMVNRILDFSAQQRDGLRYSPQELDLSADLRRLADTFAPHVEMREARLLTTIEPDLVVHVDPDALHDAVVNLLENAIKYTPDRGSPREIELRVVSHLGTHARIEVHDRGIGIPEAERHTVFRGFQRASNAGEVRGAGIGLYLVRDFAIAHHGSVIIEGRPGGGTIVRLDLPLAQRLRQDRDSPTTLP